MSEYERLRAELPQLKLVQDSTTVNRKIIAKVQSLSDQALFDGSIQDRSRAKAARAGLLLAAGGLEEAHEIVQGFDTAEARYWHGIVHRREPDSSNAKYWFRRLGHHPVFDQLVGEALQNMLSDNRALKQIVQAGKWDPFKFVDLCDACENGRQPELLQDLLALQQQEINCLLDFCFQRE